MHRLRPRPLRAILLLLLLVALAASSEAAAIDSFTFTGNLLTPRFSAYAALLNNGKVLVAGGQWNGPTDSAELYDPATGMFTATGNMVTAVIGGRTITSLPNGKILLAGGFIDGGGSYPPIHSAELYDPATRSFTATGDLTDRRYYATATLLPNGQVLIAGGVPAAPVGSAEQYDPASGTFTFIGPMKQSRTGASATLLPNGKVLIEGGIDSTVASAELYDPQTLSFAWTGNPTTVRCNATATLLQNGKVLIAGGGAVCGGGPLAAADLYDPDTGVFTATGSLNTGRLFATTSLLPDGKVLIAGGQDVNDENNSLATAELYDPATGQFTAAASMNTQREDATATVLPGSRVLIAGGDNNDGAPIFTAEIYTANVVYRNGFDGP